MQLGRHRLTDARSQNAVLVKKVWLYETRLSSSRIKSHVRRVCGLLLAGRQRFAIVAAKAGNADGYIILVQPKSPRIFWASPPKST